MIRQRKPIARGAPPKRKARPPARRATQRRSARVLNPAYLDAVRALPCYWCCRPGPSEADHQGKRPPGRKADDDTAVPMCRECHQRRTDGFMRAVGGGWVRVDKATMRLTCDLGIAATQQTLGYPARLGDP